MDIGKGRTKTATWLNIHWSRLWLSMTLGIHNLELGIHWSGIFRKYNPWKPEKRIQRHFDFRIYLLFVTISIMYFIDPWDIEKHEGLT